MHDSFYEHQHELDRHEFLGCCLNCRKSLMIIKPRIMGFHKKIKKYGYEELARLSREKLYRLYQILDDVAHLDVGDHLGELILTDPDIGLVLPVIRSYYSDFFKIHEAYLANEIIASPDPWSALKSFPLFHRYEYLVKNQGKELGLSQDKSIAFIGCGSVPLSLILASKLFGSRSVGFDVDIEAVDLARSSIKSLGLESKISIVHGNESGLSDYRWDAILVAALAEPKSRIFKTINKILREKAPVSVSYRTYTGIRAVLYHPVKPDDIKGFKIINQITPKKRVNNTLVFLEVEQ